jgi:uncharacterized protein YjbK
MIVGILLLITISTFLFITKENKTEQIDEYAEKTMSSFQINGWIQSYTENCLDKTARKALIYIGNNGGYYVVPELYDPDFNLPYYFYENKSKIILKEEIENQLAEYVDNEIKFCLENFIYFEDKGYSIKDSKPSTIVKIKKNQVNFKLKLPLKISQDVTITELSNFEVNIHSRLDTIYSFTEQFLDLQVNDSQQVCLSCLIDLAIENDLKVEIYPLDESYLFQINDEKAVIEKEEEVYSYKFVNLYDFYYPENGTVNETKI